MTAAPSPSTHLPPKQQTNQKQQQPLPPKKQQQQQQPISLQTTGLVDWGLNFKLWWLHLQPPSLQSPSALMEHGWLGSIRANGDWSGWGWRWGWRCNHHNLKFSLCHIMFGWLALQPHPHPPLSTTYYNSWNQEAHLHQEQWRWCNGQKWHCPWE